MFAKIEDYCNSLISQFRSIPSDRKKNLETIAAYIRVKRTENKPVNLIYICTHNSRRSHFGQVWGKAASEFYEIHDVNTYSGGTEVTAFNINAINALRRAGFDIKQNTAGSNPIFQVYFDLNARPVECFSKVYDDDFNPQMNFAAIMTCSEAEQNCPYIQAAEKKISTTYSDPKDFDNTPEQDEKYDERCRQIAMESLYIFSKV